MTLARFVITAAVVLATVSGTGYAAVSAFSALFDDIEQQQVRLVEKALAKRPGN